jgi:hypothetical protein
LFVEFNKSQKAINMNKVLIGLAVVFGVLVVMAIIGSNVEDDGRGNERRAIKLCWEDQVKKSNTPALARFIAGACETMESDFKKKYGVNP